MKMNAGRAYRGWMGALASAVLLGACGGGGGSTPAADPQAQLQAQGGSCVLSDQMTELRQYMRDAYYFNAQMPDPAQSAYTDISSYFQALLYTSNDPTVASDKWSYVEDKTTYQNFFNNGAEVGYGLQLGWPDDFSMSSFPIELVDPASPAYAAGLRRGQMVVGINGQALKDVEYKDLINLLDAIYTPQFSGQQLSLDVLSSGVQEHVNVLASNYKITFVQGATMLTTPAGAQAAYVRLDAFVTTAQSDLNAAMDRFTATNNLIIDLRFDGGGSLDMARQLVNRIVGQGHGGQVMAQMHFNSLHTASNRTLTFTAASNAGWHNVYVLTGFGTCSASEFVINALKPYVNVVQIGQTTCGKPFGFQPKVFDAPCDQQVFSAENFELFNANGEGRYYAGMTPTCDVADDLAHEPGTAQEGLTGAALAYIDTGRCAASSSASRMTAQSIRPSASTSSVRYTRPGLRNSMWLNSSR